MVAGDRAIEQRLHLAAGVDALVLVGKQIEDRGADQLEVFGGAEETGRAPIDGDERAGKKASVTTAPTAASA